MATAQVHSGLPTVNAHRVHFDIYAVIEAPQELYFGHETQVNVNMVETVHIARAEADSGDETIVVEKCYLSPTKRRGVERRSLIWAPVQAEGVLLGDKLGCGIPHTCSQPDCPICAVYGGLITSNTDIDVMGKIDKRKATTTVGRLVHGGGVAIQEIEPSVKQRAMHPSTLHRESDSQTPMPFKRQYNEPGLLYPVYNHCMSITDVEFQSVAYAFLDSLFRLGAGNPKGVHLYDHDYLGAFQPLLVVDRYLAPLGKRPVISPSIHSVNQAIDIFVRNATSAHGASIDRTTHSVKRSGHTVFERWIGNAALVKLQENSADFALHYLAETNKEST